MRWDGTLVMKKGVMDEKLNFGGVNNFKYQF